MDHHCPWAGGKCYKEWTKKQREAHRNFIQVVLAQEITSTVRFSSIVLYDLSLILIFLSLQLSAVDQPLDIIHLSSDSTITSPADTPTLRRPFNRPSAHRSISACRRLRFLHYWLVDLAYPPRPTQHHHDRGHRHQ